MKRLSIRLPRWRAARFMADWTIGRRLGAGFGLTILGMVAVTAVGTLVLYRVNAGIDVLVRERIPHGVTIATVKNDFRDIQAAANKIVAIGDPQSIGGELATIDQATRFVAEGMAKLEKAPFLRPEERQRTAELKQAYADFAPKLARFVAALKDGDPQQAMEQARTVLDTELQPSAMAYLQSLDTMIGQHEELAAQEGDRASELARRALVLMLALTGAGSAAAVAVALLVSRAITNPLKQAVAVAHTVAAGDLTVAIPAGGKDETGMLLRSLSEMNASLAGIVRQVRQGTGSINVASHEIAAATASLSARTEQQADALGASASSLNQLAGNVSHTAANAELAHRQAQTAAATAARGGEVVAQVVQTMELIKQSSQRIADIIGVVDGIAFQTNILALNAAVEAARAGDQGRGFAVVAAEVRNLAHRSAASAKEIKALIGASVANVDVGAGLVDNAGRTMDEVVESVQTVARLIGDITAASREQSVGIGSVNESIRQMDEVTQQNAAMVEEAFGASEELKSQALALDRAVGVFRVDAPAEAGEGTPVLPGYGGMRASLGLAGSAAAADLQMDKTGSPA
ncbi:methyl-accepting chemotaxis protein [Massilia putida]|uniref:methyl-accepting chemotaxis protein n=1 Tax=Massilia putida TaxID=1141883 RepID=UPI0014751499|nr:methyl-accepting chemotaxis protein [Massilia putida]